MSQDLFQLTCSQCGGVTSLDPGESISECRYCGSKAFVLPTPPPSKESSEPLKPAWSKPRSISFSQQGGRITFGYRWFSPAIFFLVFFSFLWDGFLLFWYSQVFFNGAAISMGIFALGHVAVGIGITYYTMACFVNTSALSLDSSQFSVQHGPMPWFGNRVFPRSMLQQFFVQKHEGKKGSVSYTLSLVLSSGERVKILGNLASPEIGQYLEQQLEKWGKIQDRPVEGEIQA